MKRSLLVAAWLFSACNDTIPGLCKVDGDCAGSADGRNVCYQGVCVAAGDEGNGDAGAAADLGTSCSAAGQCASGYCADGVCCDAPCNDRQCQRCDGYSTSGAGHCGVSKAGTDPDGECQASCSGLCSLQIYSCNGTSYTCAKGQTTPIPSGSVCVSNAATKVSTTNNCGSGNNCADGACQASQWWASCDGQGACRAASDPTDALVQPVVAAAGHSLTSACGTNGTSFCGDSCVSTGIYRNFCDGSGHCSAVTSSEITDCGLYVCDASTVQCKTQCSVAADCAPSLFCNSSVCHGGWDWEWADWNMTSPPATRYTVNVEGTVTDNMTGLVWQQGVSNSGVAWSDSTTNPISYPAAAYCSSLSLAGGSWRLPTAIELLSIVKPDVSFPSPSIDTVFSLGASKSTGSQFWTSTPFAGSFGSAWSVDFGGGNQLDDDTTIGYWVRCVR